MGDLQPRERLARTDALVVSVAKRACAIPIVHVVEIMRPLRVEPVMNMPDCALGLAIIRGRTIPVVHLGRLLDVGDAESIGRFVTLRLGDRALAVAVTSVLGVRKLAFDDLEDLPSILGPESAEAIESVGRLDEHLLLVLRATRIAPEALWSAVAAPTRAS